MLFCKDTHIEHLIKDMVQYAETARRDGVLALESVAREAPDPFLRRGLQLTIDGTDPEIIERIMRIEIESMLERHKHGKHFWACSPSSAPAAAWSRASTAQVAMFSNLDGDAAVIGAALAVALVGTLYGALLQNLVAGPIAEKLGLQSKEEALREGNHPPGRAQHPGRQQPARRRDAAHELPQRQASRRRCRRPRKQNSQSAIASDRQCAHWLLTTDSATPWLHPAKSATPTRSVKSARSGSSRWPISSCA